MLSLSLSIQEGPFSFPSEIEQDPLLERWDDLAGKEYGFGLKKRSQYWLKFHQTGTFLVQDGITEVSGFPEPGADLRWFRELFFRIVVPWMIQRHEWECLHASAVFSGRGVLMFAGPSCRGKSTMARAFCESGAAPYADDAAPFLLRDGKVFCARLPQSIRPREPGTSQFPRRLDFPDAIESYCDLESSLRPLSAIYLLDSLSDPGVQPNPVIERVRPADAFRLLLEEAHCISVGDAECNRKMIRNYLSLADLAPVFRLSRPARLDAIPQIVECVQRHQESLLHWDPAS